MTILESTTRKSEGRFGSMFDNVDGKIQCRGRWVFIDIYDKEESSGGLILVKSKKQHIHYAKVLSVGPESAEYGVSEGDDVIVADFRMEVLDGNKGFIDYANICAVVEPEE